MKMGGIMTKMKRRMITMMSSLNMVGNCTARWKKARMSWISMMSSAKRALYSNRNRSIRKRKRLLNSKLPQNRSRMRTTMRKISMMMPRMYLTKRTLHSRNLHLLYKKSLTLFRRNLRNPLPLLFSRMQRRQ
jgi:hypothetical protein